MLKDEQDGNQVRFLKSQRRSAGSQARGAALPRSRRSSDSRPVPADAASAFQTLSLSHRFPANRRTQHVVAWVLDGRLVFRQPRGSVGNAQARLQVWTLMIPAHIPCISAAARVKRASAFARVSPHSAVHCPPIMRRTAAGVSLGGLELGPRAASDGPRAASDGVRPARWAAAVEHRRRCRGLSRPAWQGQHEGVEGGHCSGRGNNLPGSPCSLSWGGHVLA